MVNENLINNEVAHTVKNYKGQKKKSFFFVRNAK